MAQVKQGVILAAAEAELLDGVAYYNQQSEGPGFEFAAEVQRTIGASSGTPLLGILYQSEPADAVPTDFPTVSFIKFGTRNFSSSPSCI